MSTFLHTYHLICVSEVRQKWQYCIVFGLTFCMVHICVCHICVITICREHHSTIMNCKWKVWYQSYKYVVGESRVWYKWNLNHYDTNHNVLFSSSMMLCFHCNDQRRAQILFTTSFRGRMRSSHGKTQHLLSSHLWLAIYFMFT